jgi:Tfp pilus assembly protein PilN
MRAVNLIPADARSGGGAGAGGRSGGAVYALLGGLVVIVAMTALWATTSAGVKDKRAQLGALQAQVAQIQAGASGLQTPSDLAQERTSRTATVRTLVGQRLDWAATLDAIGRTLPADTTLTALDASAVGTPTGSPGAAPAVPGAAGAAGPTVELNGCAPSQRSVARLMPRLRTVPGVLGVQLVSSAIGTPGGGSTSNGAAAAVDCTGAAFQMVLAFAGKAAPAGAPATGATAATTSTTPATTTSAAPAPAATTPTTSAPAATTTAPAAGTATTVVPTTPSSTGAGG